jgi:RNA polymerase sigma-70 factor, ECF subfamily
LFSSESRFCPQRGYTHVKTGATHLPPAITISSSLDRRVAELAGIHQGFVKAVALKLAPAPGLADDIAQQVFLEFVSKREKWDLERDVRPLLAVMTRNVARRFWRERCRAMSPEMRQLAEHIRELSEKDDVSPYQEEEVAALRDCLAKLPAKSQTLVRLHYYLGTSSVDIASQLPMRADAVRRALFRLRGQLRLCIERALTHA